VETQVSTDVIYGGQCLLGQDTPVVFVRAKNGQKERISIKKYLNIKCAAIVSKVPNRKSTL
jgi:hypothetical protein